MIYLDHASTTAVHPVVRNAMAPCLSSNYGNPSSLHEAGIRAATLLGEARDSIAKCLGASDSEIIFTSGGSESNNLAFRIAAGEPEPHSNRQYNMRRPIRQHIITSAFEHPSVLRTAEMYERAGFEVTRLPVSSEGLISPEMLKRAIRPDTIFISVMMANNEIGTIQPIRQLAKIAHNAGILFHTDAVQAFGAIPINIKEINADMLSASGHKIYGPKGIGFLYVSSSVHVTPLIYGGGQEQGRRAGTENMPGIAGIAAAASLADMEYPRRHRHITMLRDRLAEGLQNAIPDLRINGTMQNRLPANLNICIPNINGSTLLGLLDSDGICASSGSACSASETSPSHVLTAIGLSPEECYSSVRLTLGIENTPAQIDYTIRCIAKHVHDLRSEHGED